MIRVAVRQFRTEAIVGVTLLVATAIVLVITGAHLHHVYDAFEHQCRAARDCANASNPVQNVDKSLQGVMPIVVLVTPALLGLFFGAPLIARELENGTYRLAWTQSITRKRWIAVKLGLVGLFSMAVAGLLTWMVDWWAHPLLAANGDRFGLALFGIQGVAPIGYAAFALALGVAAGVLLRHTVAAMVVTGVGFGAARLVVTYLVRPNLASPVRKLLPLSAGSGPSIGFTNAGGGNVIFGPPQVSVPNGWVYSTTLVDKAGHAPTAQYVAHACPVIGRAAHQLAASGGRPGAGPSGAQIQACIAKLSTSIHTLVTYQPASRFWPFQLAEMGIFIVAALALCGCSYWWLRRRYA
ncbi:MAG: ABC transporter permease subunit [Actinomycetota bacterium]|nr:ABC transporter permease subunit [Actinomycetota bacterium]